MIFTKKFRIGKLKAMISGGISRKCKPYVYGGIKTKKGISAGASVGSEGKKIYGSLNKKGNQIRVRHNITSGNTNLGIKLDNKDKPKEIGSY